MLLSRRDWRTNTRRHLLPVLSSMRERRVAVVLWCVWHALILRSQGASDVVYSRSAAVVLLALSPCLYLRAALSLVATGGLTRAVISCLCSHPCANDV